MKVKKSTQRAIDRRTFFGATGKYTVGGLAALGMLGSSHLNSQTRVTADLPASSLISNLSTFVVSARYDSIPPAVLESAKIAVMDCLGVTVAGAREESAQIAARLAREEAAKGE